MMELLDSKKGTKKEFITADSQHWYPSSKKPDIYYPSVTTVLSVFPKGVGFNKYLTAQTSWETSQEILAEAGKRGTNVHKASEILESGGTILREGFTVQEWQMLMGFVKWHQENEPRLWLMEHGIVSDKLKIGGTIDRVYMIGESSVILDIKTSGSIYDNYWVQVAAYAKLWEEQNPEMKIDKTAILRLSDRKQSGYEIKYRDRKEWQEDFKIFKATKQLWDYLNPDAKPKILELPNELTLINSVPVI